jgi:spore coat polysaccharide biosynthesis protein SpsF
MNNYAIILSRLDSKRLPQKAFSILGNKFLIDWCISGISGHQNFDVILATTNRESDDPLENFALKNGIKCFRGDHINVAKRIGDCIIKFNIKNFARINADSPFIHGDLVSQGFRLIEKGNFDFVTNLIPRTYPYGISLEVFKSDFYLNEYHKFTSNDHFEHVTKFFYENINSYNVKKVTYNKDFHNIKFTVDTEEDLDKLNTLIRKYPHFNTFKLEDQISAYQTFFHYD